MIPRHKQRIGYHPIILFLFLISIDSALVDAASSRRATTTIKQPNSKKKATTTTTTTTAKRIEQPEYVNPLVWKKKIPKVPPPEFVDRKEYETTTHYENPLVWKKKTPPAVTNGIQEKETTNNNNLRWKVLFGGSVALIPVLKRLTRNKKCCC